MRSINISVVRAITLILFYVICAPLSACDRFDKFDCLADETGCFEVDETPQAGERSPISGVEGAGARVTSGDEAGSSAGIGSLAGLMAGDPIAGDEAGSRAGAMGGDEAGDSPVITGGDRAGDEAGETAGDLSGMTSGDEAGARAGSEVRSYTCREGERVDEAYFDLESRWVCVCPSADGCFQVSVTELSHQDLRAIGGCDSPNQDSALCDIDPQDSVNIEDELATALPDVELDEMTIDLWERLLPITFQNTAQVEALLTRLNDQSDLYTYTLPTPALWEHIIGNLRLSGAYSCGLSLNIGEGRQINQITAVLNGTFTPPSLPGAMFDPVSGDGCGFDRVRGVSRSALNDPSNQGLLCIDPLVAFFMERVMLPGAGSNPMIQVENRVQGRPELRFCDIIGNVGELLYDDQGYAYEPTSLRSPSDMIMNSGVSRDLPNLNALPSDLGVRLVRYPR